MITLLSTLSLVLHIQLFTLEDGYGMADCSAVYVAPTEALTAAHCVEDATNLWVKNYKGQSFSARVIKIDKVRDLCLLRINCPKAKYARLGNLPDKGDKVYIVSNAYDMPFTYTEGLVGNILTDPTIDQTLIIHTAHILSGSSGSGLFDSNGNLVGINIYAIKVLSGAVDIVNIKEFLDKKYLWK